MKEKNIESREKESDTSSLRGYCRVCNRFYFFKHGLETKTLQFHQHHGGICQNCGYTCARINNKTVK